MVKHILTALFAFAATTLLGQGLGLHFMTEVGQMNLTNPAAFPEKRFYLGLGTTFGALSTNIGGGNNRLFILDGGEYLPNFDQFVDNLDDENFIRNDAAAYPFILGFRKNNWGFTFHAAAKTYTQIAFNRDFVGLLLNGNAAYIGETLNLNPSISAGGYGEIAAGVSYSFLKIVNVGVRAKYLIGWAGMETTSESLNITTDEEYYQLDFDANYTFNVGGVPQITTDDSTSNFQYSFNPFTDNRGFAVDLGATVELGRSIRVAVSVLDLGSINWEDEAYQYKAQGVFQFDGIDVKDYLLGDESTDFGNVLDSLSDQLTLDSSPQSFRTKLSPKLYSSAKIRLGKQFDVGVVLRNEFTGEGVKTGFGVGFQKTVNRLFSFGAMYSIQNGTFQNLGANASLKVGPIQVFVVSDNILPFFGNLYSAANTNLRVGFNFTLNEKEKEE